MGHLGVKIDKDNLIGEIKEKLNLLPQKAQDAVIDVLNIFMLVAQVMAPYLTGALRDSIQVFLGHLDGYVTSELDYFKYVILGTDPHTIGSPIWIPHAVGWIYIGLSPAGRGNEHPGTKPNDFMQDTYDEGMAEAETRVNTNILEWLVE